MTTEQQVDLAKFLEFNDICDQFITQYTDYFKEDKDKDMSEYLTEFQIVLCKMWYKLSPFNKSLIKKHRPKLINFFDWMEDHYLELGKE